MPIANWFRPARRSALAVLPLEDRLTPSAPAVPPGMTGSPFSFTNSTATPLTDAGVTTSQVTVSGAGAYLWDLDLTTFLPHTNSADLDVTLTSPAGTVVTLTTDNGGNNDNVFDGTVWDDQANPGGQVPYTSNAGLATDHPYANNTPAPTLAAEEALAAFIGEDPNGTWTITISDDLGGDAGTLAEWTLTVTTALAVVDTTPAALQAVRPIIAGVNGVPTVLTGVDLLTVSRTALPWTLLGVQAEFSEAVDATDATVTGLPAAATLGSGDGTATLRWTFAGPITNLAFTLGFDGSSVTDLAGNAGLTGTTSRGLSVRAGDVTGDNGVTSTDLSRVRSLIQAGQYDVFADVDGDGDGDQADFNLVRGRIGR